jgi:hypothetical protein
MPSLVFRTPGLIDLRAFTLMGVSVKPNSTNPIGMFGTGLKYAIATLVRLGAEPVVYIGLEKYTFFKRKDTFRGADFEKLSMRRESFKLKRGRVTDLPYAVSYGRNWQPWMVYRELESNTRDEGGETFVLECTPHEVKTSDEQTLIVCDLPALLEAHEKRDDIFLPDGVRTGSGIQVVDKPSTNVYWRGLKVMETRVPCRMTYNFLDQFYLTEDRTLAGEWQAKGSLGRWVVQHDNPQVIEKIVDVDDDHWESQIDYDKNITPSDAFRYVMERSPKRAGRAYGYFASHDTRPTKTSFRLFDVHPLPWRLDGNRVYDAKDKAVFEAPYDYEGRWEQAAKALLVGVNSSKRVEEIAIADAPGAEFEPVGDDEDINAGDCIDCGRTGERDEADRCEECHRAEEGLAEEPPPGEEAA